jgi:hypothetical protein
LLDGKNEWGATFSPNDAVGKTLEGTNAPAAKERGVYAAFTPLQL